MGRHVVNMLLVSVITLLCIYFILFKIQLIISQKPKMTIAFQGNKEAMNFKVPNIVHYNWYNTKPLPFKFHHMLSVLSVYKFIKPDIIYFHTNMPPTGEYWEIVKKLSTFKEVKRDPPKTIFGKTLPNPGFETSYSDTDRVKLLTEYGGIYMDLDVIALRSFDDLRRYVCTIGYEAKNFVSSGIIVCSKDSAFLYLWMNYYIEDPRMDTWNYNAGKIPFMLSKRYPDLVHIEERSLNRPNFKEVDHLIGPLSWDWENNYAIHLWYRVWKDKPYYGGIDPNFKTIKTWNNTFGEISLHVLKEYPNLLQ